MRIRTSTSTRTSFQSLDKDQSMTFPGDGSGRKDDLSDILQLNAAEMFTLTTSGGTSIEVLLRDPTLIQKIGGEMPTTKADKAIQSIRTMLRDKKGTPG